MSRCANSSRCSKTIVCVSDLHVGSRLSICPPTVELSQGGVYRANKLQAKLYAAWMDLCRRWAKPDVLVCVGDAIDGQGRKNAGTEQWTTDLYDQLNTAAQLLRAFKAKKICLINGTGYHVDAGGRSLESILGDFLKAEPVGPNGSRSAEELFMNIGGKTFHFSHHIEIGTGWYKTTPLARELVFALLNETSKHRVDIIVRAHIHSFVGVEFSRQRGFILPCWQAQTRYMIRRGAFRMVPEFGALRFIINDGTINVEKFIFKLQEAKPQVIEL